MSAADHLIDYLMTVTMDDGTVFWYGFGIGDLDEISRAAAAHLNTEGTKSVLIEVG